MNHSANSFDKLLHDSRERIAYGDTYLGVERYLQSQKTDKEVIDSIFAILVEEERQRKILNGPKEDRAKRINLIIFNTLKLAGGILLMFFSYYFLGRWFKVGYVHFMPVIGITLGGLLALSGIISILIALFRKEV